MEAKKYTKSFSDPQIGEEVKIGAPEGALTYTQAALESLATNSSLSQMVIGSAPTVRFNGRSEADPQVESTSECTEGSVAAAAALEASQQEDIDLATTGGLPPNLDTESDNLAEDLSSTPTATKGNDSNKINPRKNTTKPDAHATRPDARATRPDTVPAGGSEIINYKVIEIEIDKAMFIDYPDYKAEKKGLIPDDMADVTVMILQKTEDTHLLHYHLAVKLRGMALENLNQGTATYRVRSSGSVEDRDWSQKYDSKGCDKIDCKMKEGRFARTSRLVTRSALEKLRSKIVKARFEVSLISEPTFQFSKEGDYCNIEMKKK